jgi:hypothetical protein
VITCTRCKTALGAETVNTFALIPCPTCNASIRADVYPALFRKLPSGHTGDLVQTEKEAGCFYHPAKKAAVACSVCGRFLCALCDVEFNNRHLCPMCLEKGKTKRKIKNLENHSRPLLQRRSFFLWSSVTGMRPAVSFRGPRFVLFWLSGLPVCKLSDGFCFLGA